MQSKRRDDANAGEGVSISLEEVALLAGGHVHIDLRLQRGADELAIASLLQRLQDLTPHLQQVFPASRQNLIDIGWIDRGKFTQMDARLLSTGSRQIAPDLLCSERQDGRHQLDQSQQDLMQHSLRAATL